MFADELSLTNENQLEYMIQSFPIKRVREIIKKKAKISKQPTLPWEYYHNRKSHYSIEKYKVNVAYFGSFYQTRNLNDLFDGLENVNDKIIDHIRLHIFTADPKSLNQELKGSKSDKNIKVNPYVNFNEFLNLTTLFDCLVVNDARTSDNKPVNPYLPSKLSDYLGSETNIWGIYEKNSILSKYDLAYKSELGNIKQATAVFEKLFKESLNKYL